MWSVWHFAAIAIAAMLLAGCAKSDPPSFHMNMLEMEQQDIPLDQQQAIANVLEALFGTPDQPYVLPDSGLDLAKVELASGPVWSDESGKQHGLYRQHCGHCHGTTGDGMGPTAAILNPYPRDYRQGKFKFKSTERAAKPTHIDLERIVRHGVPGTAMPAFDLLPDDEIESLIEYVKYLSMRGETEIKLAQAVADLGEGEKLPTTREFLVDEILKSVAESWSGASEQIINPPAESEEAAVAANAGSADAIAKGRQIFYDSKTGNCVKCHGPSELGDGQTTDYDDWSKRVFEMLRDTNESLAGIPKERAEIEKNKDLKDDERAEQLKELAEREQRLKQKLAYLDAALPPRTIQPRNLRLGIYRGGRRPIDIYRRALEGINGTPMPGVGELVKSNKLTAEDVWNLVAYVRSLPYESISKPPRQRQMPVRSAQL